MPSAIEMFGEQRDAADQVNIRLIEASRLLKELHLQAAALAADQDLRAVLREEKNWLAEARAMVAEVRYLRQAEDHRWSAVLRRWVVLSLFALAAAMAAGAGYAAVNARNADAEVSLRSRAEFADAIQRRLESMTPAERRQFNRLLTGGASAR